MAGALAATELTPQHQRARARREIIEATISGSRECLERSGLCHGARQRAHWVWDQRQRQVLARVDGAARRCLPLPPRARGGFGEAVGSA